MTQTGSAVWAEAHVGDLLRGRYRLDEILVRRAEIQTWRAFDVLLARPVLVHLLAADRPNETLLTAAKKAAVATDFRVLPVLDAMIPTESEVLDADWHGPYIVCEYAPGQSLENLLAGGPLSTLEAAWLVREVADALAGLHARGLYHQRLSPDTVVITVTGNVKIVGFLLEAEMDRGHETIRDPQAADVQALGHLLYATLVSRWPGGPDHGMAAAPTDADGRPRTAREVLASVPPSLDQICDRILNPAPRDRVTPLRTAADVSAALSRVLGTADATPDLEHRVQPSTPAEAAETLVHEVPPAYAATAPIQTTLIQTTSIHAVPTPTAPIQTAPIQTAPIVSGPTAAPLVDHPKRSLRWRRALVPLALIAVVGSLTAVGLRLNPWTESSGDSATASAAVPSTQWPVVATQDFDPEGNGEEHPQQVSLAWDGNPETSWRTMNYKEAEIGNKTGVGLIFDLGETRQVSRVELELDGNGTSLDVRVPTAAADTTPPLVSANLWRPVGAVNLTPAATSIGLDQPVQTRYVLIYLTELPAAGAEFTGGIAEARFWS